MSTNLLPNLPADNTCPAVCLENVSLAYGEKTVLRNVTFEVDYGETCVILGATGAGKSLLLKLLVGLIKPDSGKIFVEGREISRMDEKELYPVRRRIGMLFQEGALFDSLSVFENVAYRILEEKNAAPKEAENRVREILKFVEMEEASDKFPAELSGGMRRRVALARAMADSPCIMLYDSPTGGLDPVTAYIIVSLIVKLRDVNRVCSLLVTHNVQDALVMARYVYDRSCGRLVPVQAKDGGREPPNRARFLVLHEGSLYFWGSEKELVKNPDPYLRRLLS